MLCSGPAGAATEAEQVRQAIERLHRDGQSAQALQRVERAVTSHPGDAGLRFLLGVLLSESRRDTEATQVFERLIQDFPELPEPYNNLAVLHASKGQWDKSRELLESALRNDPTYLTAHRNLGDVLVRLALRAYQSAAGKLEPDEPLARRLRLARELAGLSALP
jgi:Flp pilus assembly protein TadD